MKPIVKSMGLIAILFFAINFLIPFVSASITHPIGGGGSSSGYYLEPPTFYFTPVSTPAFSININWGQVGSDIATFNILGAIQMVVGGIGNSIAGFFGGYIGAILTNGALYVVEVIYWFFAYLEYLIINIAVSASAGLGIWSLTVFIVVLIVIATIIVMLIKIAEDAVMIAGAGA